MKARSHFLQASETATFGNMLLSVRENVSAIHHAGIKVNGAHDPESGTDALGQCGPAPMLHAHGVPGGVQE